LPLTSAGSGALRVVAPLRICAIVPGAASDRW
jgi:hypothetical protein